MEKRVNSQFIKEINERRILNLIRSQGIISRIEIAKRTKISKVAVSEIVSRLSEAGYILELGKGHSTSRGGKRPTMIKLNPANGYVVGIEIHRIRTTVALADLESHIIGKSQILYEPGTAMDAVLPSIIEAIDELLQSAKVTPEKLAGIGIGLPGFIDYLRGELVFADTLRGWQGQPLVSRFARRYHVPVFIENDVNAITIAEYLMGAGRKYRNLVCIWVGEGIGAGIIVNNELIRGDYGSAGEIGYFELGHHIVDHSQFSHLCNGQRYFGDVLGEEHFLKVLNNTIREKCPEAPASLDLSSLPGIVNRDCSDPHCITGILDEYAGLLGIICTDLIKTINPSLIILTGKLIDIFPDLIAKTRGVVKLHMSNIPFEPVKMVAGQLREDACLKGVIEIALQLIFEPLKTTTMNHINLS